MDYATFFSAIAALGTWVAIGIACFVLWRQNKKAKELVCLQLFLQLSNQYESSEMNIRRANLSSSLLNNREVTDIDDSVLVFFENVGLMVKRGLLDIDLVDNVFGFDIINYNNALEKYFDYTIKKFNDKTLYANFDYLAKAVNEHCLKKYGNIGSKAGVDKQAVDEFLRMEIRRKLNISSKELNLDKANPQTISPIKS